MFTLVQSDNCKVKWQLYVRWMVVNHWGETSFLQVLSALLKAEGQTIHFTSIDSSPAADVFPLFWDFCWACVLLWSGTYLGLDRLMHRHGCKCKMKVWNYPLLMRIITSKELHTSRPYTVRDKSQTRIRQNTACSVANVTQSHGWKENFPPTHSRHNYYLLLTWIPNLKSLGSTPSNAIV